MSGGAPEPGSPEWGRIITASKVPAIIGVSPWESPRSLWLKMKGAIPWDDGGNQQAKARGNYLEAGVLAWWLDQHPEITSHATQVHLSRDLDGFTGAATLDAHAATRDGELVAAEAKTSSQADEWGQPGTEEIPVHYLTQCYWQMAVDPGLTRVYVPMLGPFLRFAEYVVERDDDIITDLIDRCAAFHASLTDDEPPDLDDHPATVAALRAAQCPISKGETTEIPLDVALAYLDAHEQDERTAAILRRATAGLIDLAGDSQYLTAGGIRFARQQVNRRRPVPLVRAEALAADTEGAHL